MEEDNLNVMVKKDCQPMIYSSIISLIIIANDLGNRMFDENGVASRHVVTYNHGARRSIEWT